MAVITYLFCPDSFLASAFIFSFAVIKKSTRRFCALPSSVSFEYLGADSPYPLMLMREPEIPLAFILDDTALALLSDQFNHELDVVSKSMNRRVERAAKNARIPPPVNDE